MGRIVAVILSLVGVFIVAQGVVEDGLSGLSGRVPGSIEDIRWERGLVVRFGVAAVCGLVAVAICAVGWMRTTGGAGSAFVFAIIALIGGIVTIAGIRGMTDHWEAFSREPAPTASAIEERNIGAFGVGLSHVDAPPCAGSLIGHWVAPWRPALPAGPRAPRVSASAAGAARGSTRFPRASWARRSPYRRLD